MAAPSSGVFAHGPTGLFQRLSGTIRKRLFLLLTVVFLPIFVYLCAHEYDRYNTRRTNELQANIEVARAVAATFDEFIHDVLHQELAIGTHLTFKPMPVDQMNEVLKRNNTEYPVLRNLAWISPEGRVLASSFSGSIGLDVTEGSYFDKILAGREWVVTDLFLSQATGEPVFSVVRAVRDQSKRLLGMVAAVVLPDKLGERISFNRAGGGAITVMDRHARVVFSDPKMEWGWNERGIQMSLKAVNDPLAGREYVGTSKGFRDGIERMMGVAPIPLIGWAAAADRPMTEAMAPVKSQLTIEAGFFLFLTGIVLAIALVISRSIEAPIQKLRKHAHSTESLLVPIDVGGTADLNDLAFALHKMAKEVKSREDELVESEEKFRSLAENSSAFIIRYDDQCRHTYVNAACAGVSGLSAGELIGRTHRELGFGEKQCDALEEKIRAVFTTGEPQRWELEFEGAKGHMYLDWQVVPEYSPDGKVMSVLGVSHDITERRKAEEMLRLERRRLKNILDSMPDGICITNREHAIEYINPVTEKEFGTLEGKKCYEYLHDRSEPCGWCANEKVFSGDSVFWECFFEKTGKTYELFESPMVRPDGSISKLEIFRDITERKQAEEERKKLEMQLRHSQKIEAVGTLAGGIAHDFNNILSGIIGFTELAHEAAPEESSIRQDLDEVLKSSYRARDLIQQILTFSHASKDQQPAPVEVTTIVQDAFKMLRASLPRTIEIRQRFSCERCVVFGDPTQIHQVVINLCTNAAYAMRDGGGVLEVGVDKVELPLSSEGSSPELEPGAYVCLTLSDTGHGIDAATKERIFEPYFTTKEIGEGAGLGLAVVHGIIKRHNGAVTVESEPGRGTAFKVYLPRLIDGSSKEAVDAGELPRGTERILFVDDEEAIIRAGKRVLENLGYRVIAKTSSEEAFELLKSSPQQFDLLITDYTMPGMTGADLALEAAKIRPGMPVILCTGYSEQVDEERAKALGIREYLMKPLVRKDMAQVLRRVLDD